MNTAWLHHLRLIKLCTMYNSIVGFIKKKIKFTEFNVFPENMQYPFDKTKLIYKKIQL